MTAGIIKVMPTEIVLVADTLCLDGATGAEIAGAEKLFIHAGKAAIFSWGRGPGGVQQKVSGLDSSEARPEALAQKLREAFREVPPQYSFGLYVAGFDGASPSLWHVDVPTSEAGTQDRSANPGPHLVAPATTHVILVTWLGAQLSTDDPVVQGVDFVQRAHALAPSEVGADTKRIRVTAAGAGWI